MKTKLGHGWHGSGDATKEQKGEGTPTKESKGSSGAAEADMELTYLAEDFNHAPCPQDGSQ